MKKIQAKKKKFSQIKESKISNIKMKKSARSLNKSKLKTNKLYCADGEIIKCMREALGKALEENERLKEQEIELHTNNKNLKILLNDKIAAVKELATYFENCRNLHSSLKQNFFRTMKSKSRKR
jgi:hypothetical protein